MNKIKVVWTQQAKQALKNIYNYYKAKSLQGAKNVKNDILLIAKTICYSKQYQVDEFNPKYRRIIVRKFKLLYKETKSTVYIMDILSTEQSPDILKSNMSQV